MYARNEDTLFSQPIRELSTEHSRNELIERVYKIKRRIKDFEYNAESPEDLFDHELR